MTGGPDPFPAPDVAGGPDGRLCVTAERECRCTCMTDSMVQIPADRLALMFLSLRRGTSDDAHSLAGELRPFTERPGQRVPVPRTTVLRTALALRKEIESSTEQARRTELSEQAEYLVGVIGPQGPGTPPDTA